MPFNFVCAGCGVPVVRHTRVTKARVFCSRECYQRSCVKCDHKRECLGCSATFDPCKENGGRYRKYCNRECFEASVERWSTCERCGEPFRVAKGQKASWRWCSDECRRPPVFKDCKNCGKRWRVTPSKAENPSHQFCSVACYRSFGGETSLEFRVRRALETLGIPFKQEHPIKKWSIDFALTKHMIAIEADGIYWHKRIAGRDSRRDAELTRAGWRIVRLPEADVDGARDVGQFILDRMREATGLQVADLISPDSGTPQAPVETPDRWSWHTPGRRPNRIKRSTVDGQLPLWGGDVA